MQSMHVADDEEDWQTERKAQDESAERASEAAMFSSLRAQERAREQEREEEQEATPMGEERLQQEQTKKKKSVAKAKSKSTKAAKPAERMSDNLAEARRSLSEAVAASSSLATARTNSLLSARVAAAHRLEPSAQRQEYASSLQSQSSRASRSSPSQQVSIASAHEDRQLYKIGEKVRYWQKKADAWHNGTVTAVRVKEEGGMRFFFYDVQCATLKACDVYKDRLSKNLKYS